MAAENPHFNQNMSLHQLNKEAITIKCIFLYPSSVIALSRDMTLKNLK